MQLKWKRLVAPPTILIAVALLIQACGSDSTTSPDGGEGDTDDAGTVIGAEGGSVASADGALTLTIPAGALGTDAAITITPIDASSLGPEWAGVTDSVDATIYDLGPDGLTFDEPLTVSMRSEIAPPAPGEPFAMAGSLLLTAAGGGIEALGNAKTRVDLDSGVVTVSGELDHFSPLVHVRPGVTFEVQGVPDVLPVGEEVEITALIRPGHGSDDTLVVQRWEGPLSPTQYSDASSGPFEPAFPPSTFEMTPFFQAFEDMLPYTCTAVGPAEYGSALQARVSKQHIGTTVFRLDMEFRKHVDCVGARPTLVVTKSGTGSGTVTTTTDDGIDCGDDCEQVYDEGTAVELAAVPDEGSEFVGWEGDGSDVQTEGPVRRGLVMDDHRNVNAVFDAIEMDKLSVYLFGDADGTITSDPEAIDCTKTGDEVTGTCTVTLERGATLLLSADVESDVEVEWTGATETETGAMVTMDGDVEVTATFNPMTAFDYFGFGDRLQDVEALRFIASVFTLPPSGTSGDVGVGGMGARAADDCPAIMVAGTGGAIAIDSCDATVLQEYHVSGDPAYYDAFALPVPEGESGLATLLLTGNGYTLLFMNDSTGEIVARATTTAGGQIVDGTFIGNDPRLGAAVVRADGDLSYVDWSGGDHAFDGGANGAYLAPGLQSAVVDASRDHFLSIGNEDGAGVLYFTDFSDPPNLVADRIADLAGDNPRRIRCDYSSGLCAISDFANSLITIVQWDGVTAPTVMDVTTSGSIADGPVGLDVYGQRVVAAGFNDDQYTIIRLNADGTIASTSVSPLTAECSQPGHAMFLRDSKNTVLVSCWASAGVARIENAF